MSSLQVLITRLDPELPLPQYSKGGDAGADIVVAGAAIYGAADPAASAAEILLHFCQANSRYIQLVAVLAGQRAPENSAWF